MTQSKNEKPRFPLRAAPIYAALYIGNAAYLNNISNFLKARSLSEQGVGTLLALVPIAGMAGQLIFGPLGDKTRHKNTLLIALCVFSACCALALGVKWTGWILWLTLSLYAFFHLSIEPMLNSITLEILARTGSPFGPVRMVGTLAFAAASPLIGWIIGNDYLRTPYILASILALCAICAMFPEKIQGHARTNEGRAPLKQLLQNKQLLIITGFAFIIMVGISFFYVYFPILLTSPEIGASSTLLGVSALTGALAEVPFLFFSDRIIKKIGAGRTLMLCALTLSLRWALIYVLRDKYALIATQVLHSMGFIVVSFVMVKYVDIVAPNELKATGQMFASFAGLTASRAVGALLAGFIVSRAGIRPLFLTGSLLTISALAVFAFLIRNDEVLSNAGKA